MQIPGSFCYAELTSAYPEDGGHYLYFREAGFKLLTFVVGWITFLALDAPAVAVMAIAISNYLAVFIHCDLIFLKMISALIVIFFAFMHIRSVKIGGIVQATITVIKIIPFILIVGIGAFYISPDLFLSSEQLVTTSPGYNGGSVLALFGAIALCSFSFDGMFAGCYISGEIKNPQKTLPLGLVLTALIVMVLYIALSSTATGLMPINELAASNAPIATMASKIPGVGQVIEPIIAGLAVLVVMGTISSCLLYMPRFEFAMARDGLFFSMFGKVHKKYNSPHLAIIVFTIIVLFLIFVGDISSLLSSLAIIIFLKNTLIYGLIFILRKKENYKPSYKTPGNYLTPVISFITSGLILTFAIFNAEIPVLIINSIIIIVGAIAYFI